MAKKRGGIAGVWDRNKGVIKTLAPMALGMIPGVGIPLAAAAGAAMAGFDRPGRRGIGFDPFEGVKGGVTGAASGAAGAGIQRGVAGLFAPKTLPSAAQIAGVNVPTVDIGSALGLSGAGAGAPAATLPSLPTLDPSRFANITGMAARTPPSATMPMPAAADAAQTLPRVVEGTDPKRSLAQRLLSGTKSNWELISGAGNALNTMLGQQTAESAAQAALEQRRLEYERQMEEFRLKRQETEADRENRRRLTQLLMPLLMQQFGNVLPPVTTPKAG